ncbi:MAG: beta-ketoacyl synthase, partial [Prevotella sp.]|nr:beta-ketoacyl synthase [Prevotella sp.]
FIISGFQSLMALSPMECRPFDIERVGLNLGEAAATIIYDKVDQIGADEWQAVSGAVRNDAHHISNPSRTGEGSYRAIRAAMGEMPAERLAFVNVHGTSTLYNDEMEAVAVNRAGLKDVPVNSLKGYYGHTMGAAGVLETILSMQAVNDGCILGTRGFEELGVSKAVRVSAQNEQTDKRAFLKLLSGFGGCNAAMLFEKGGER